MQVQRHLVLLACVSCLAIATANIADAAPAAGISQAAPAVAASETTSNGTPLIQKTWWYHWHHWHHWHHCWHCWHHW